MFQGTCCHCDQPFTARSPAKKFCKPSHRVAYCVKTSKVVNRTKDSVLISYQDPEIEYYDKEANKKLFEKNSNMKGFTKVELIPVKITDNSSRKIIGHDEDGLPVFAQDD